MAKSLRIGGYVYTVDCVPLVNNAEARYGECNYNQHNIRISSEFPIQQQQCTLLHEVVHAIDNWFNIGLEESQVEQLGKGLYEFLCDNPKWMSIE